MLIKGARVNNLKNVTLEIPRGKLVVVTGISGSGKSSLAFDTLFAEGQRRFAESLSSYARQFLGRMTKPDVDGIEDIPPAIAIEQKVNIKNPRSTVATTTEVYDYLRLIYARIGRTFSPVSGREVRRQGVGDVMAYLESQPDGTVRYILADLNWKARTDRTELLLQLKEDGYNRLWADGKPLKIEDLLKSGSDPDDAWLLIDRFRDLGDREKWEYSDVFFRVIRELQFLKSRPEWDGKTLISYGGSLGGILSAFAAAIDKDVTLAIISVPSFCECNGYEAGRPTHSVYRKIPLDKLKGDPGLAEGGFYYDAVNFGRRIGCETYVCTGFVDESCCPSNVFAFYNAIPAAKKTMTTNPRTGHFGTTKEVKGNSRIAEIFRSTTISELPKN